MARRFILLLFTALILLNSMESDAKVRFTSSTGFSLKNDFSEETAGIYGVGLHLLYPITNTNKMISKEIGVANWYNYYTLTNKEMQTLRFGLAIRIYFNLFEKITPFFTHDILSQITYLSDRKKSAGTHSIIVGLGAKIPQNNRILSVLFTELTYSRFRLIYFELEENYFSFLSFNFGAEF